MSDNNILKCQSAKNAHHKLINLLEQIKKYEHSALLVFSEMFHQKLYEELGYSSMLNYAMEDLEFSQSKAYFFIKMSKDLEALPETKKAVESGELGWTKAKEITKVATAENEGQWIDKAKISSRRELVVITKQATQVAKNESKQQPNLIPVEPLPKADPKISKTLSFSIEQLERFNVLIEKLRKNGETGSREELLLKALDFMVGEDSSRKENRQSTQIVITHCPECNKAETGSGEISVNNLEKAYCDAVVNENGRNKATIKPSTRQEVMIRDRHTCQGQGCSSKRYLEVHHKVPRSAGGGNEAANLVTLCSACHRLVHRDTNFQTVHL